MKPILFGIVAGLFIASAATAQETGTNDALQGQWPIVASFLVDGGLHYADAVYDEEDASVGYWQTGATLLYNVPGTRYLLGINGLYRDDKLDNEQDFEEDYLPDSQWRAGIKALRKVGTDSRVGFFASYGEQKHIESDDYPTQSVALIGVEGQTLLSDEFLIYAQAAVGDNFTEEDDDAQQTGFHRGYVVRGGVTWFACDSTAINLDAQTGGAGSYVYDAYSGRFIGVSLSGETRLPVQVPLFVGYGIRHRSFNALDWDESVNETEAFLSLRIVFGAETPEKFWLNGDALDVPELPARASAWAEWMDE